MRTLFYYSIFTVFILALVSVFGVFPAEFTGGLPIVEWKRETYHFPYWARLLCAQSIGKLAC